MGICWGGRVCLRDGQDYLRLGCVMRTAKAVVCLQSWCLLRR